MSNPPDGKKSNSFPTTPARFGSPAVREGLSLRGATHHNRAAIVLERRRRALMDDFNALLKQVDVIVTPTIPIPAAKIGQDTAQIGGEEHNVRMATTRNMRALNLTGLPLLQVPCGLSSEGLPIGLQIIGRLWDEVGIMQVGHAYEQATAWHKLRPAIATD